MSADAAPSGTCRTARATQVVAAALALLEAEGPAALTMRRLAAELGIRAPTLYKHVSDKAALEAALAEQALVVMGHALRAAVARPGRRGTVAALLAAYRRTGLDHPHLYRLATTGELPRHLLPAGLEAWAGEPFYLVAGDGPRAQALFSFAHGMVILELDGRYPPESDLDGTWRAGAKAFA